MTLEKVMEYMTLGFRVLFMELVGRGGFDGIFVIPRDYVWNIITIINHHHQEGICFKVKEIERSLNPKILYLSYSCFLFSCRIML